MFARHWLNCPLLLLLIVCLLGALTACSGPTPQATQETTAPTTLTTSTTIPATTAPLPTTALSPTGVPTTPPTATDAPTSTAAPTAIDAPTSPPTAMPTQTTAPTTVPPQPSTLASPTPNPQPLTPTAEEIAMLGPQGYPVLFQGDEEIHLDGARGGSLAWSPDGYRLGLNDGVRTFGADLHKPPVVSPIYGHDFRWSGDGKQLAWLTLVGEESQALVFGGPDGDNAQLAGANNFRAGIGPVVWSRDGRFVSAGGIVTATDGTIVNEGMPLGEPNPMRGEQVVWAEHEEDETTITETLMLSDGSNQRTLATLHWRLNPGGISPSWAVIDPPRLFWLPDGSGVLLPIPWESVQKDGGTWLIKLDGATKLVSPHTLTDLHADGEHMLARTDNGEIVIEHWADGSVDRNLGVGYGAAWRPALRGSPPDAPLATKSPTLSLKSPRMSGPAVRELQQRLKALGYTINTVDGIFGPQTDGAVRTFQELNADRLQDDIMNAIKPDGVVGPKTWAVLRSPDPVRADER